MSIKLNRNTYVSFVFFVFSILFFSPVLSPKLGNVTVYLYWFVPFLDGYFDIYIISKMKKQRKEILATVLLIFVITILRGSFFKLLKIITIFYTVIYVQYAHKKIGFKQLYRAFNINVYIALAQFLAYLKSPELAYLIGPRNIATMIWGAANSGGNTNFYPIWGNLPRVSGLSREAGFFAALINVIVLVYIIDKENRGSLEKRRSKTGSYWQIFLFFIAYCISFSKMSLVLPLCILIYYFRKEINKVPFSIGFGVVWACLGGLSCYLNNMGYYTAKNESIAHRFYGYGIVFEELSIKEFLIGNANGILELNSTAVSEYPIYNFLIQRGFDTFCGYAEFIICFGYIGLLILLFSLRLLKMETMDLWILFLLTFDVDLTTATSFVALAYWLVICGTRAGVHVEMEKVLRSNWKRADRIRRLRLGG